MTTIYVGNLPFTATEDEVRSLFERYGKVDSVKLINDRETGRPRGFAFVDMGAGDAPNAIQQTNGFQMSGLPGPSPRAAAVAAAAAVLAAGNRRGLTGGAVSSADFRSSRSPHFLEL